MITLSKLNGEEFVLNCDLIEMIMENPDTTILLTNGKHLIVRESKEEVVERIAAFRRKTDVYKRQTRLWGLRWNPWDLPAESVMSAPSMFREAVRR